MRSATSAPSCTPSGSSANDRPAYPRSCAACNPNSEYALAASARPLALCLAWRREEALAHAAPLAAPVGSRRRRSCFLERDGLLDADDVIAGRRDLHVRFGELETIALAAAQFTGCILEVAALDPLCRTVGVRELQ